MPLVPTIIDRYEIKGRLGSGGMGTLYLARDTNPTTDRLVVLKLLRTSLDSDELVQRFRREARALAELNHPNIVVIYDSGEFDGSPFIVMEYVRGETLAELIRRHAPIPLGEKLRLLSELCAGLAHAHEAGIIHRDIKPANLVVDPNGRLKILDFGIARVDTDATLHGAQLTRVAVQIGTPGYMSPEQLEAGEVDARSDLFAVGAVAYELIAGHEAFPGANTRQIERQVISEQPVPLVGSVPGLDPEIEAVVASALEKDRGRRCQSAVELGEAFERLRARIPGGDRQPRATPSPRPTGERKPRRERAADSAYERAVTSYREGGEEGARRFAIEALAEHPEHEGARRLLTELGRFRDVEPWLPAPPPAPAVAVTDSSATLIAAPAPALDSSETLVAQPLPAFDDSETLIAPGLAPPRPVAQPEPPSPAKPKVAAPQPKPAPAPPKPASAKVAPAKPAPAKPAPGPRAASSPASRWALIGVVAAVLVVVAAVAAWFLWPSGTGGQATTTTAADGAATAAAGTGGGTVQPPVVPTEHLLSVDAPAGGTIEGPGITCGTGGTACSVNQAAGADVTLVARPDAGFTFGGFTGECSAAGVVTMTAPRRCGAVFTKAAGPAPPAGAARAGAGTAAPQSWALTIVKPTGGTILGDRIKCGTEGTDCTAKYPAGAALTLRHQADAGHTFSEFTGDCSPAGRLIMTAARNCGATFAKAAPVLPANPMILTVTRPTDGSIVGNGIECGPPLALCSSPQPTGAAVRLMARPRPGFVFTGFTGDCDAGGVVTMTASRTCGATFAKADSRLPSDKFPALTVAAPRNGTIVGPGIECGTGGSRCRAQQPAGSTVLLRVTPDPGFLFVRFTGDCDAGGLTVMSGSKMCAVSILSVSDMGQNELGYPTLTVTKPVGGTVLGNGIECGTTGPVCSAPQPGARQIRLLARPDVGFVFVRFSGDCDASGVTMMDGRKTCGVTFVKGGQ